jgi:hypothetical protein
MHPDDQYLLVVRPIEDADLPAFHREGERDIAPEWESVRDCLSDPSHQKENDDDDQH